MDFATIAKICCWHSYLEAEKEEYETTTIMAENSSHAHYLIMRCTGSLWSCENIEIHYCGVPVVKLFRWYLSCKSSAGACWFWKMVCLWDLSGFQVMWCSCWRRSRFPFPDKCWGQLLSRPLSGPCESFRECRREIQSTPINFISERCPVSSCTEVSGMLKAIKWHLAPSFQRQVAVTL